MRFSNGEARMLALVTALVLLVGCSPGVIPPAVPPPATPIALELAFVPPGSCEGMVREAVGAGVRLTFACLQDDADRQSLEERARSAARAQGWRSCSGGILVKDGYAMAMRVEPARSLSPRIRVAPPSGATVMTLVVSITDGGTGCAGR